MDLTYYRETVFSYFLDTESHQTNTLNLFQRLGGGGVEKNPTVLVRNLFGGAI